MMGSDESKALSQDEIDDIKENTEFSGKEIKEWYVKFHEDFPDGILKKDDFIQVNTLCTELFKVYLVVAKYEGIINTYTCTHKHIYMHTYLSIHTYPYKLVDVDVIEQL